MTGARLTSTRFAVQVSGASPFWCAKATRDATMRQSAKYHQEHEKVLAQLPPQVRCEAPQSPRKNHRPLGSAARRSGKRVRRCVCDGRSGASTHRFRPHVQWWARLREAAVLGVTN